MGGGGRAGAGAGGPDLSSILEMLNQQGGAGFGGTRGAGFGRRGGAGGGGLSPQMLQKIMSNPQYSAAFSRAQKNPRVMSAIEEVAANPSAFDKYKNDPDVYDVLKMLKPIFK